jgi:hypothetical protein
MVFVFLLVYFLIYQLKLHVPCSCSSGLDRTVSQPGHVSGRFQIRVLFFLVIITVTNVRVLP